MHKENLFKYLVPSSGYWAQCLHHAVMLGVRHVTYLVAKGGQAETVEIIGAVLLESKDPITSLYSYLLEAIQSTAFKWVGPPSEHIPRECEYFLRGLYASDPNSFCCNYSLSRSILRHVDKKEPPHFIHPKWRASHLLFIRFI